MRIFYTLLVFLSSLSAAFSIDLKPGFVPQVITASLTDPTSIAFTKDGRVFVTEKSGRIMVVENNALLPNPLLEIPVEDFGEQGLQSIELDPHFEHNGYIYVYFTVKNTNHNRVSRFVVTGNTSSLLSETILFELDDLSGVTHNGGALRFGKDKKLYFSTGDGEWPPNSQSLNSLLGKVLRINSDGTIPADNPFYTSAAGNKKAIWALGFRNPFTMDIDTINNRIYVNDVGLSSWEEINNVVKGNNYGWSTIEGVRTTQPAPANYSDPIFAYSHSTGCAIAGAAFYRPQVKTFPSAYWNAYFYADFCTGYIWTMDAGTAAPIDTFAKGFNSITNLRVAPSGDLYFFDYPTGSLVRIFYQGTGQPFISEHPQNTTVVAGETAEFSVKAYGNPPMEYAWYINGTVVPGATSDTLRLIATALSHNGSVIHCRITNSADTIFSENAVLTVTNNQRPVPLISAPISNYLFRGGDTIAFSGSATDPEDGALPGTALSWKIFLHHDTHKHPVMDANCTGSSSFVVPITGELDTNIWYRIHLEAEDSWGLTGTTYIDVHPVKSNFTLNTIPSGLMMMIDGPVEQMPYIGRGVEGKLRIASAPLYQPYNDSLWKFDHWQNGSTGKDTAFSVGDNTSLTAVYAFESPYFTGSGDGLNAVYRNDTSLTAPVVLQRIEPQVNYKWRWLSPHSSVNWDYFMCTWTGSVLAPATGEYTFYVEFDDAARLYIDDTLRINKWLFSGYKQDSVKVHLTGGEKYPIILHHMEGLYQAECLLKWRANFIAKDFVPQEYLYSYTDQTVAVTTVASSKKMSVYPNPASERVTIELPVDAKAGVNFVMKVYNASGMLVKKSEVRSNREELNIRDLDAGVYFVFIQNPNDLRQFYKAKFIKE